MVSNHFVILICAYLCRAGTEEVKRRTNEAKRMLNTWKESYFDVRAKIEASGRDQRWEFDRKKLFDRTDYMAAICQNLYDVAQVQCSYNAHSGLVMYL